MKPAHLAMAAAVAVIALAYAGDFVGKKPKLEAKPPREAQVIQTMRIGEHETIRVLTVPDPILSSEPMLDTRCLIYVNQDIRQATIKCLVRASGGPD